MLVMKRGQSPDSYRHALRPASLRANPDHRGRPRLPRAALRMRRTGAKWGCTLNIVRLWIFARSSAMGLKWAYLTLVNHTSEHRLYFLCLPGYSFSTFCCCSVLSLLSTNTVHSRSGTTAASCPPTPRSCRRSLSFAVRAAAAPLRLPRAASPLVLTYTRQIWVFLKSKPVRFVLRHGDFFFRYLAVNENLHCHVVYTM